MNAMINFNWYNIAIIILLPVTSNYSLVCCSPNKVHTNNGSLNPYMFVFKTIVLLISKLNILLLKMLGVIVNWYKGFWLK